MSEGPRTAGVSRRQFLKSSVAAAGVAVSLRYAQAATPAQVPVYRRIEDLYRNQWTWDRVAHGTHGTNCAGTCAFRVYVRKGVVWREEQQAMYGPSGEDVPDYGPRGCQKGLRHSKYMYGKQRVLYPMKRVGKRGAGRWQRISWTQAADEIADRYLDVVAKYGPDAVSCGPGTQLAVKLASYSAVARFANITGAVVPEFYSGVGDLPTGVYMTTGQVYLGDTMAAVYKSRCCLVWMSNPAVTRIPDAHFFWEARYNGTEIITIGPEFTPTAMHSSKWLPVKPGTDTALAMAMLHVILTDRSHDVPYMQEQTDLPLLVRTDTGEFLRETDVSLIATLAVRDNVFYFWDKRTNRIVQAPGTGLPDAPTARRRRKFETLALGPLDPALEGRWTVETRSGPVEVTTVFELLKKRAAEHAPDKVAELTGVSAAVIRTVARQFAQAKPAMIYTGYSACKWLHGDILQRAMLLLLAVTGNTGPEGGGLHFANAPKSRGLLAYAFAGVGPATRLVSGTTWDYDTGRMKELNTQMYGQALADTVDEHYQHSVREDWFPQYGKNGWKMAFFAGENGANWRASQNQWRKNAFDALETIVTMVPDAGQNLAYADYVLPIAHHYERHDVMLQSRHPYIQVLDKAVEPIGESCDDFEAFRRIAEAISRRAAARGMGAIQDNVDGRTIRRDYGRCHELYTMNGSIRDTRDIVQFVINTTPGVPKMSYAELASKGIVRVEDSDTTHWAGLEAPYHSDVYESVRDKRPYETLTGRQQYYIDHEWFLKFDEALPGHKAPLTLEGFPLQMTMGHARHGVHSMWRDDSFLLSLQRGEPDIYVSPVDAAARGVADGEQIEVHNPAGSFICMAHVSSMVQPGTVFMYHGWDPMMFKDRRNFSAVISTAGLIKPTSMAGDYGHLGYRPLAFAPNQTYRDFTVNFRKARTA